MCRCHLYSEKFVKIQHLKRKYLKSKLNDFWKIIKKMKQLLFVKIGTLFLNFFINLDIWQRVPNPLYWLFPHFSILPFPLYLDLLPWLINPPIPGRETRKSHSLDPHKSHIKTHVCYFACLKYCTVCFPVCS